MPTSTREPIADAAPVTTRYPNLAGKVAVVTGAARGLGAAFVDNLVRQGVRVVGADIDLGAMQVLATEMNDKSGASGTTRDRLHPMYADVTKAADHREVAETAVNELGRLDFWVNNAGIFPASPVLELSAEQLATTLSVNVESVLYGSQAAARHMTGGGAIVNISSTAAHRSRRDRAAYCASKAAVGRLTQSLALELGDLGIRVNSVAPGFVDTTMTHWIQNDPPRLQPILDAIPLHRFASPEEIAAVVLFLLSESARYVTGCEIAVDGGASA